MVRTGTARLCVTTVVLAAVAVLVGGAQAAKETPVIVAMAGRAYQPAELTVGLGQTVVWQNQSITHHTVTSTTKLFESSSIAPSESYSVTFSNPGTFDYECTIHPTMKGSIVVLDLAPGTLQLRLSTRRTSHGAVAVAHIRAARSGPVLLQVHSRGAWQTVGRGTLNAQGQAAVTLTRPARRFLRVVLPAHLSQPRELSRAERSPA
jgi:plastocyanin